MADFPAPTAPEDTKITATPSFFKVAIWSTKWLMAVKNGELHSRRVFVIIRRICNSQFSILNSQFFILVFNSFIDSTKNL